MKKTQSDYILEAPDEWDYEYKRLWAKYQLSQDKKRELTQLLNELQASNERLRIAALAVCQECVSEIDGKYSDADLVYPSMQRNKESDMAILEDFRKVYDESPKQSLAAIRAEAVIKYGQECERLWGEGVIAPTAEEYTQSIKD